MGGIASDALLIVLALFLVALNGLFVAAEFGLVKIRSTQVDGLVREGRRSSGLLKKATDKLDAYLSVCQLGITISSLGLGALGEPAIASLLEPVLAAAGLSEGLIHAIAFAVGFGIITFLHVVFGELAPKSVAIARTGVSGVRSSWLRVARNSSFILLARSASARAARSLASNCSRSSSSRF